MRKYLLPQGFPFYKANLHCHSTASDGDFTPQELKEAYKAKGYSILAYTDHEVMVPHPELNDPDFLALHGYEIEIMSDYPLDSSFKYRQTCHLCLIATEPDLRQVYWTNVYVTKMLRDKHPELVAGYADTPDTKRTFSPEGITDLMMTARNNGFFVTYNHPTWSLESYPQYMSYKGADALEIINYGCVCEGFNDRNEHAYDDMLRSGERLYVVGADDNHGRSQFFGGYTMIKAESLTYKDIAKSLKDGNFYASEGGPKIEELYIEDGHICVKTDSAREIFLSSDRRICSRIKASEARIPIREYDYFRITAVGQDGKCSWTRAYFVDTL